MILSRPDPENNPYWYIAKKEDNTFLGEFKPNKEISWRDWLDEMSHIDIYGCTKKDLIGKEEVLASLSSSFQRNSFS